MFEYLPSPTNWALHAAAAGTILFAAGWIVVRRVGDPAQRHRLGRGLIQAGLLVAVLCALPAWLLLPLPVGERSQKDSDAETVPVLPATEPLPPIPQADPVQKIRPNERLAMVILEVEMPPVLSDANFEPVAATVADETNESAPIVSPPLRSESPESSQPIPSPWSEIARLVSLAYLVGVLVAAVPLAVGLHALMRLRGKGRPAPAHVQALFDELRGNLRVRLLVSPGLGSPVCFGLFRPVVLLPEEMLRAPDADLRWVFAHELDHLRRGDAWTNWWTSVATVAYFAVPWFWSVRRDLQLTQEYLADAAAAALGRAEDYAAFLVRLSGSPAGRRHPLGANAVRARKSELYRRVSMLLSAREVSPQRVSRRWSITVASLTVGLAVLMSGVGFSQQNDATPLGIKASPIPLPNGNAIAAPPPGNPAVSAPAAPARPLILPVIGVGPFQALPLRNIILPSEIPLPAPGIVPPIAGIVAVPNVAPLGNLDMENATALYLRTMIAQLKVSLDQEQAKGDDKENEAKIKALKAQIESLTKELERAQKEQPQPNANKRVVVGGQPQPGVAPVWVQRVGGAGGNANVETRLGVLVDRVPSVLADQLDLPKGQGVVITSVIKDSSADKAGLKSNDIVLEFAGKPVADGPAEFMKSVNAVKVGDKVDLVVLRKGKKETIKGVEVPEAKRSVVVFPDDPNFTPLPLRPGQPLTVVPPVPPIPPVSVPRTLVVPKPLIPGAPGQRSMQVQIDNDTFTIQANEDGLQYRIEGAAKDGKPVANRIVITGDGAAVNVQSLDKVPEKHKERVKQLLEGVKFAK